MPDLIANRYEPLPDAPDGPRLPPRARDVAFNRVVVLESLGADFRDDPAAREGLARCLGALHGLPGRHLVRYFAVEENRDVPVLVREWVAGFSLLELLLERRALGVDECVQWLEPLPGVLDQLSDAGLRPPDPLLGKVLFAVEAGAASAAEVPADGSVWPLKFDPISVGALAPRPNAGMTVIAPRQRAAVQRTNVELLADLLREVLGGRRQADGCLAPLAALGEGGNALLRAVEQGGYADCTTFWDDFKRAVSPKAAAVSRTPRRPCPPLAWEAAGEFVYGEPAEIIRLIPDDAGAAPIHLNARPYFRLGRAHHEADYTTRVEPETDENYERTGRIGRVHVWCEVIADRVTLRDGNGKTASSNGSWFKDRPLPVDPPTLLSTRGTLNLAGEYELEVLPLFCDHLDGCHFNDFAAETALTEARPDGPTHGRHGGVIFVPMNGQRPICDAVWLFTGVGFGLDRDGCVRWDRDGEAASPGAFLYHKDRFWIKNLELPDGAIAVDGIPVPRGQIAPLNAGQVLRLGSRSYGLQ